jgi:hypothetical protein
LLHTLRCIGFAGEGRIGSASDMAASDVVRRLSALSRDGHVSRTDGPFGGWGLTETGRDRLRGLLAVELEAAKARPVVRAAYESFLSLNADVLDVCHDWQMRRVGSGTILNDHRDPEYDAEVLSRLIRLDRSAQHILADLARRLARYGILATRLSAALDRALAGDIAAVTDDLDAYHTVWYQLHEDLLVTLCITRQEERGGLGT